MITSLFRHVRRLLLMCGMLLCFYLANAQSTVPGFVNGKTNSTGYCAGSGPFRLDTVFKVYASVAGSYTYRVIAAPSHGTISNLPATVAMAVGYYSPTDVFYTETSGFTGADTFAVSISNGVDSNTIKVYMNVVTPAGISLSYGTSAFCAAGTATAIVTGSTYGYFNSVTGLEMDYEGTINLSNSKPGTYTVIYQDRGNNYCNPGASATITIAAVPVIQPITGNSSVCVGWSSTLANAATGGTRGWWSSDNNAVAKVDSLKGTVTGYAAGTANITYHYTNDVCTSVLSTVFTVKPGLSTTVTYTGSPYCKGNTGVVVPVVNGNTDGVFYDYGKLGINSTTGAVDLTNIAVGSYYIKYQMSCGDSVFTTLVVKDPPVAAIDYGINFFCGKYTISPKVIISGAVYSCDSAGIVLDSNTGTINLGQSKGGVYTVKCTAGSGSCIAVASTTITINSPNAPAAISFPNSTYCQNSGSVPVVLTGNTDNGSFYVNSRISGTGELSINSKTGTVDLSNSGTGTFKVAYLYGATESCTDTAYTIITVADAIKLPVIKGNSIVCEGSTTILANDSLGGTWSSSDTTVAGISGSGLVTGAKAGTSTISYKINYNGCVAEVDTLMTVTAAPVVNTISGASVVCVDGVIQLSDYTTGGVWKLTNASDLIAGITASGVVVGVRAGATTATYTVTNSKNCSTAVSHNITVLPKPIANIAYTGSPYCALGTATVTQTGQTGGVYSSTPGLQINSVSGSITLSASTPGTYTVNYVFTNGSCSDSVKTSVVINAGQSGGYFVGDFRLCEGSRDTFAASKANGYWMSNNTSVATIDSLTGLITALKAGSTVISYITGTTCSGKTDTTVTVLAQPVAGPITGDTAVCVGNHITLTDTTVGGVWSSSNTAVATVNTGGLVTGIAAGSATISYRITSSSCSATAVKNIIVKAKPAATISYPQTPYCKSGTATVTQTGQQGGTYFASPSGQVVINSSTGAIDLVNSKAGTYTITYYYSNGSCADSATAGITINELPAATVKYSDTTFCPAGTAPATITGTAGGIFNASGGLVINDTTGSINLSASTPGTYTVNYSISNNNCIAVVTTKLIVKALPVAAISYGATAFCNTGTANVTLTGTTGGTFTSGTGLVINSITGAVNLASSATGNYTVTYTFSNGFCSSSTSATVAVKAVPSAAFHYSDSVFCNTGSITATVTGTQGGVFSAGSGLVMDTVTGTVNLASGKAGRYSVQYTVTNGACSAAATALLIVNAVPTPAISYKDTIFCATGSATATITGTTGGRFSAASGLAINDTTGTIDLLNSVPNRYTVSYTAGNGSCTGTAYALVDVRALPAAAIAYAGSTFCAAGTAAVTITGTTGGTFSAGTGLIISSTTGTVDLASSVAGTYTVSYTVSNGACSKVAATVITISAKPATPTVSANGPLSFCEGSSVILTSSSATGNQWLKKGISVNGATGNSITVNASGSFQVTVINAAGCSATSAAQVVTVVAPPVAAIQPGGDQQICKGDTLVLQSDSATGNQWYYNGTAISGITNGTYLAKEAGEYHVVVSNIGCADTSASVQLTVNELPELSVVSSAGNSIVKGTNTKLTVTSNQTINAASWTPTASLDAPTAATVVAAPTETTLYTVDVTGNVGCVATDTITIAVTEASLTVSARSIMTPNGDGVNDNFIIDNVTSYPDNVLRIFDRNGKTVYEKRMYDNSWNGTSSGVPLATDTYFYVFTVQGKIVKKGTISIIH